MRRTASLLVNGSPKRKLISARCMGEAQRLARRWNPGIDLVPKYIPGKVFDKRAVAGPGWYSMTSFRRSHARN